MFSTRNYVVTMMSGRTCTVRASSFQAYGGERGVTFIRETPGTDPNWNPEYGPQVDSTQVAYFSNVESVVVESDDEE